MTSVRFAGRVGFIGCGAMARALAGGLAAAGVTTDRICGSDPDRGQREAFANASGGHATEDNASTIAASDVVVLAVKPAAVRAVLRELDGTAHLERPLWVSLAAGVRIEAIEAGLPAGARIVRSMPNTPALVRSGATALCGNAAASEADLETADALFSAVGITWRAPEESALDVVTGLSGSGPAYVFLFLEALEEAGIELGLPREAAAQLALHTVYGAAKLARERDESPAALREQVTSPGGTTQAGLQSFEADDFRSVVSRAVAAAMKRSVELSRED